MIVLLPLVLLPMDARADIANPQAPERGLVTHDLPPPGPPGGGTWVPLLVVVGGTVTGLGVLGLRRRRGT
ncbi:MAG: hypothetical protein KC656_11690 [Myxococcales bacterium]|nr:hypothetical protein [Myxococcales bacterium]MCB9692967.1 hypothetical protein [Alphaproteobacteria bacterium]